MKSKTKIIIIIIINKNNFYLYFTKMVGKPTHGMGDRRDPPPVGGGVLPTG
jgi:hypothetical protein